MFSVSKLFITFNKEKEVHSRSSNDDERKMLPMSKSHAFCHLSKYWFFKFCYVLDLFLSTLVTRPTSRKGTDDGGHQEEDAGHEGREGQPDGQMRCL